MQTYQIQLTKQQLEDLQRLMEWGREDRMEWMAHHHYDGDEADRSEDERIVGSGYESLEAAIADRAPIDGNL